MESTYDFTLRRNKELSVKSGYELVYFIETKQYGTKAQNRFSICTSVNQAIKKDDKLFNRITIKNIESDLVRNFKPTNSTLETHNKKVEKTIKDLGITKLIKSDPQ